MYKQINKTDVKSILRKVMLPIGLVTTILIYAWMIVCSSGTLSAKFNEAYLIDNVDTVQSLIDASRYIAIASLFASLIVCGLMIAHIVLQSININKNNIKQELIPCIINATASLTLLILFIILVSNVFNIEKWSYYEPLFSYGHTYGSKTFENFSMMGAILAISMLFTIYSVVNEWQYKTNSSIDRMIRTIGITSFILIILSIFPMVLGCLFGFENAVDVFNNDIAKFWTQYRAKWTTGWLTVKFALQMIGFIAILALSLIPLFIFKENSIKQRNKYIILWSILGGTLFIIYLVSTIYMKAKWDMSYGVALLDLGKCKWYMETRTCSILSLSTYLISISVSITSFTLSNKIIK